MDQVDLAFVPDVLVVPVHSSVQFPNSDAVRHQVYSFSSARQFQLPLYRGKPYPPVTFAQPGVVTLGCNIHDNMIAYIVVTAAPFFGRTAERRKLVAPATFPPADTGCASGIRCSNERRGRRPRRADRRAARRRRIQADARAQARAAHRPAALMGLLTRRSVVLAAALLACAVVARRARAGEWELGARPARRVFRRSRILPRQRPGQAALRRGPPGHSARATARGVEPAARRSVRRARRGVDLGRRRQESHRPHRGLSRIPALSARGLQGPRASRRVLSTDVAREPRARLGDALHDHALGHRQLDRRGDPHHRPRRPGRLVRHAHRARFRSAVHRRAVRLERPGRHDARGARLRAARPADDVVRPRRRAAAGSRTRRRRSCSTRSTTGRVTTSARRCDISIARCSTSCTTTIARTRPRKRPRSATSRGTPSSTPPRCASKPATAGPRWSRRSMATRSSIRFARSAGSSTRSPRSLAKRFGHHMLAARYDAFEIVNESDPGEPGSEDGHAWTVAYSFDRGDRWRFALEWLRVTSDVPARAIAGRTGARHRIEGRVLWPATCIGGSCSLRIQRAYAARIG